jgi:hypothetical protein
MDITAIVLNGVLGGSLAMFLIFACDLIADWMKTKEQVCVTSEKGTKQ